MASKVAESQGTSLLQNARLFALLNVALADAAIMAWRQSMQTNFWRPVTGFARLKPTEFANDRRS